MSKLAQSRQFALGGLRGNTIEIENDKILKTLSTVLYHLFCNDIVSFAGDWT